MNKDHTGFSVIWGKGRHKGTISADPGTVSGICLGYGEGETIGDEYDLENGGRIDILTVGTGYSSYSGAAIIRVGDITYPFSFFLRDIDMEYPIYIPDGDVIVTESSDKRKYHEIREMILGRHLKSGIREIDDSPEED